MNKLGAVILLIFFVSVVFGSPEETAILTTDTGNLDGTLLIPENKNGVPVCLIIAGSGPTDRNGNNPMMSNNSLKMLATALAEHGIASLRYDKRGIAKSTAAGLDESELRFEHYVQDAKEWIYLLQKDKRFTDVCVIGHSEGSLIGMIASQKTPVIKFISLAGVGQSADKTIQQQLAQQPPAVLSQALPILDKLVEGETVENVPPMLNSLFRPSVQPYLISWFTYDPTKEIAKLDIPVLIVQGTTDIQVSVEDADKLAAATTKAQKEVVEGMNHILKEAPSEWTQNTQTYNQPDLPPKAELAPILVKFIK